MRNQIGRITALTLTLLIVFPLAIVAANWQWTRHHERESLNASINLAYTQDPIQIETLSDLEKLRTSEYVRVQLSGQSVGVITWWRKQSLNGIPGFIGLIKFQLENKQEVVVALGWTQTLLTMNSVSLENITARVRLIKDFEVDPSDLPIGQTNSPANILLQNDKMYLELKDPEVSGFALLPLPEMTAGPHLGYVGQWFLIGVFAVCVYIIAIRNLPEN